MYNYELGIINIRIDLENGIYCFHPLSSTGKTYLYSQLKTLKQLGEPVEAITLSSLNDGAFNYLINSGNIHKLKVLLLDRYDRYAKYIVDNYEDIILELSSHCIILLDCKGPLYIHSKVKDCNINLINKTLIEVN